MKKLLIMFFLFATVGAYAQQDAQFTQYMSNKIFVSPAFAGDKGAICLSGIYRHQWTGFEGNPQTQNFNIDMPVGFLNGGIGLSVTNDQLGFEKNLGIKLSYAYKTNLGSGDFSVGLALGMLDKGLANPQWIAPDGSTGASDPSIPQGDQNKIVPDFGFGLLYSTDAFFVSLSSLHLVPFEAEFTTTSSIKLKNHTYLLGGYNIELSPELQLQPSVLLKSDLASMQFDLNINAVYMEKLRGGLSYRMNDAVAVLLGYNITDQLSFGYAYDVTTSQLRNFSSGSHEVMLSYCFNIDIPPKTPQRYRNVRFL